jgi:hypothetical protein
MDHELERALTALGGRRKAAEMFRRREQSLLYIQDHFEELMQRYPEHWVAIYDSEVMAAALTLAELEAEVVAGQRDASEVVVRHLTKVPPVNFL